MAVAGQRPAPSSLLHSDNGTNTPEVDRAAYAPELSFDRTAYYPEVAGGDGPQVNHEETALQVTASRGTEQDKFIVSAKFNRSHSQRPYVFGLQKKAFWIVLCACLGLVAIAIAVGVGVDLTRNSKNQATASLLDGSTKPTGSTTGSITSPPTPSTSTGLASSQDSVHSVSSGTSLAAVTTSDGSRHVFFQDQSGAIRRALYQSTDQSWTAPTTYQIASSARNHTPITAIVQNATMSDGIDIPYQIHVFYFATDNTLASSLYTQGGWVNIPMNISTIPDSALDIDPASRDLSVSTSGEDIDYQAIMFLERRDGSLTVLNGTCGNGTGTNAQNSPANFTCAWTWDDATSVFYSNMPAIARGASGPFASCEMRLGVGRVDVLSAFFNPNATTNYLTHSEMLGQGGSTTAGNGTFRRLGSGTPADDVVVDVGAIRNADLAYVMYSPTSTSATTYGFWVNGTSLSLWYGGSRELSSPPNSKFPYTRLASANPRNTSVIFLYHQIDARTLAEDKWDDNVGSWDETKYINISVTD